LDKKGGLKVAIGISDNRGDRVKGMCKSVSRGLSSGVSAPGEIQKE